MSYLILILSNLIIFRHFPSLEPAHGVVMPRPVRAVRPGVLDWRPTVDHAVFPHIDPHMAHRPRRVVRAGKEDDVPRPGLGFRDMGALVINALGRGAWQVVDAAVGVDVAHETAAIKAGRWAGTAPDVRESQVFLRLPDKGRELRVGQSLPRNVVILPGAFIGVNIISKQIRLVAL